MSRVYTSERKLRGITKDGGAIDIAVGTGIPYEDTKYGAWACPLIVDGLYSDLAHMHGIDSWQALRESQKLAVSLLQGFIEKGGKLYLLVEDEELSSDELLELF